MLEKHKTKNISKKGTSGITLIALVVTIIVLLILAWISIMMLTGENGILSRAGEAKEGTIIAQEKEQVKLAYIQAANKDRCGDVTKANLQSELDLMLGDTGETDETKKKTNVKQNSNNTLNVLFTETQHNYNVNQGKVAKVEPKEDGVYINGTNVTKGLSRLLSYNDTICENLARNYGISRNQLLVEEFGQDYYEHKTDPNYMRIYREATNDYIDTLVGYIDNQEMKNLFLSYKTDEGYSIANVTHSVYGERWGEDIYPRKNPPQGGVMLSYELSISLIQYDTEHNIIKKYEKSVQIYDLFGVIETGPGDVESERPRIRLVLNKNFSVNMVEEIDDVNEVSGYESDNNDIKFVLNNEEYSNAIVGICKYLMDSIGVEVNIDDFKQSNEDVDYYDVNITEDEMNLIDQAFPY